MDEFGQLWNQVHRPNALGALTEMQGFETQLRQQAQQQATTSGGAVGSASGFSAGGLGTIPGMQTPNPLGLLKREWDVVDKGLGVTGLLGKVAQAGHYLATAPKKLEKSAKGWEHDKVVTGLKHEVQHSKGLTKEFVQDGKDFAKGPLKFLNKVGIAAAVVDAATGGAAIGNDLAHRHFAAAANQALSTASSIAMNSDDPIVFLGGLDVAIFHEAGRQMVHDISEGDFAFTWKNVHDTVTPLIHPSQYFGKDGWVTGTLESLPGPLLNIVNGG
jgi:hypothetical protein